jgi:hypothetical protein
MKQRLSTIPFITGALANGAIPQEDGKSYLRPVQLETQRKRFPKYQGCKGAGCRTFEVCICRCSDCKAWCKYRGTTIVDHTGKVEIRDAKRKLIVEMPRAEYDVVAHLWEKLGLKLTLAS